MIVQLVNVGDPVPASIVTRTPPAADITPDGAKLLLMTQFEIWGEALWTYTPGPPPVIRNPWNTVEGASPPWNVTTAAPAVPKRVVTPEPPVPVRVSVLPLKFTVPE